jgi:hypothetical protein
MSDRTRESQARACLPIDGGCRLADVVEISRSTRGPAGETGRPAGQRRTSICWAWLRAERRQILRLVLRPVTVAAIMTRIAATMMLMIHRIQSMPFVASTPSAAAT